MTFVEWQEIERHFKLFMTTKAELKNSITVLSNVKPKKPF